MRPSEGMYFSWTRGDVSFIKGFIKEDQLKSLSFRTLLFLGFMVVILTTGLFSTIILIHLLHLLSDWQEALSEAIRMLRTDGTIVTGTIPPPAHLSTLMQFYIRRREELGYFYKQSGPHIEEILEAFTDKGANIETNEIHSDIKISFQKSLSRAKLGEVQTSSHYPNSRPFQTSSLAKSC